MLLPQILVVFEATGRQDHRFVSSKLDFVPVSILCDHAGNLVFIAGEFPNPRSEVKRDAALNRLIPQTADKGPTHGQAPVAPPFEAPGDIRHVAQHDL